MVDVPPGSVVITPTEFYKDMQKIDEKVGEIRADLKTVLAVVPDHEHRLRSLERRMWIAFGAATVLGAGLGGGLAAALRAWIGG